MGVHRSSARIIAVALAAVLGGAVACRKIAGYGEGLEATPDQGSDVATVVDAAAADVAAADEGSPSDSLPAEDTAAVIDGSGPEDLGADQGVFTESLYCDGTTTMGPYEQGCTAAGDCVIVPHTADCCGTGSLVLRAISRQEKGRFLQDSATCAKTRPQCYCPADHLRLADGSPVTGLNDPNITLSCLQGRCTVYDKSCGGPCADPSEGCYHCGAQSSCAKTCAAASDCTPQSCVAASNGGKFCRALGSCP